MEELLGKYFSGEASPNEAKRVLEWRQSSEENARAFYESRVVWLAANPPASPNSQLLSTILEQAEEEEVKVIPLWSQGLFKIAVAVLLVLAVVFTVIQISQTQPYGQVMTEVTGFDLPDGSQVTLQRGASITIEDFEDVRIVHLKGKAFFEVTRDENRPFRVVTNGAQVEVLGTSFVVDNAEETGTTEVMVASGEVSLSSNPKTLQGKSVQVQLKKGEMGKLTVGRESIQKKKISDDNYLAWKTKILTFRKTSLAQVSEKLNDVYGVTLQFQHEALSQCNLSARFNQKKPEEVVDIIARTFGLTYRKSGNSFVLDGDACR